MCDGEKSISLFELRSCDRKYRKKVRALFRSNYAYDALMVLKLSKVVWFAEDDELMGGIAYRIFGNNVYVTSVIIHPDHRSRGLGTQMMQLFIDRSTQQGLDNIQLFVEIDNTIALKLYQHHGFVITSNDTDVSGQINYHLMTRAL